MTNFLALESPIKTRLRATLDAAGQGGVRIFSAPEIGAINGTLPTPCVIVVFDGYSIAEVSTSGRNARITQNWIAVACVRSAAKVNEGSASRVQGGDIADTILAAIMGWQPEGTARPLALTNPPKAGYEDGHFYLPVSFSLEIIRQNPPTA